jgi:hypothetical protein
VVIDEEDLSARARRVQEAVDRTSQYRAGCGFVLTPAQLNELRRLQSEELLAAQCEAEA